MEPRRNPAHRFRETVLPQSCVFRLCRFDCVRYNSGSQITLQLLGCVDTAKQFFVEGLPKIEGSLVADEDVALIIGQMPCLAAWRGSFCMRRCQEYDTGRYDVLSDIVELLSLLRRL